MAKKSQATRRSADQAVSISRLKLNQLIFESWLIIQGFFGLFVLLSLVTYSPQDPGWTTQSYSSGLIENDREITNSVGSWGAYLSDFLFTFIGYMAYLFPYWLLWPLLKHFLFSRKPFQTIETYAGFMGLKIFGWTLVLLSSTTLISILFEPGHSFLPEEGGGLVGSTISSYTTEPLSHIGSILLFISLLLLGFTLSLVVSWTNLIFNFQQFIRSFGGNFGERISEFLLKVREKQRLKKEKIDRQQKVIEQTAKKQRIKPAEVIEPTKSLDPSKRVQEEKQEELFEHKESRIPPKISLLDEKKEESSDETSESSLHHLGELVINKLSEYGILDVRVESIQPGPVVIRLELKLPSGLKVNQVSNINKDLARSLSKTSVRIVEVIEGRDTIGVEVPREDRQPVLLSEVLSSVEYDESKSPLTIALGKDISGSAVVADLGSMPHLLLAGTTGSGKSVALNSILMSILFKASPEQVRFILIDPKMLELSVYEDIPHLLCPVITDMKEASSGLKWCVNEMERRYRLMAELEVRNLNGYNKRVQ